MIGWANQWWTARRVCRRRAVIGHTLVYQHRIRASYHTTPYLQQVWRSLRFTRGRVAGHLWYRARTQRRDA